MWTLIISSHSLPKSVSYTREYPIILGASLVRFLEYDMREMHIDETNASIERFELMSLNKESYIISMSSSS